MLETLLGLTKEGAKLHFNPCLPEDWASFTVKYRYGETVYPIIVNQAAIDPDKEVVIADGVEQQELTLSLVDDRATHNVEVRVSRSRDTRRQ
jgi:cellobiose phosphorylase